MPHTSYPLARDARAALDIAKRIAEKNSQSSVDSLALLLALLRLPKSQVLALLSSLKVRVENLAARVSATILLQSEQPAAGSEGKAGGLNLSAENESVLSESLVEMKDLALNTIDGQILLLGMLRSPGSKAGEILAQYGVTVEQVREVAQTMKKTPTTGRLVIALPEKLARAMSNGVSPIFVSLVLFTITMAGFLWFGVGNNLHLFMYAFVISGWLVSLCLHEFGHAVTAFWGGDESTESKGYLTLNPLKYAHPIISIIIPLLLLLAGGIAFPGGAVYINVHALRKPHYRSLVSAAGPLANLLCFVLLAIPFDGISFFYAFSNAPFELLSAIGLLALLQMVALFINLLPIPGLDGFGIIEPFLPRELMGVASFLRPYGFLIIFFMLSVDSPISDFFWGSVWSLMELIGPNLAYFANEGVKVFFP